MSVSTLSTGWEVLEGGEGRGGEGRGGEGRGGRGGGSLTPHTTAVCSPLGGVVQSVHHVHPQGKHREEGVTSAGLRQEVAQEVPLVAMETRQR